MGRGEGWSAESVVMPIMPACSSVGAETGRRTGLAPRTAMADRVVRSFRIGEAAE